VPIAVANLFGRVGLAVMGSVRWGSPVPTDAPGVYAVAMSNDPARNAGLLPKAPVSVAIVRQWIERVPAFTFDEKLRPSATAVANFIAGFWLPDESIVYIGKATCLNTRLDDFLGHRLGSRSPHKGGHWLKTLSNLDDLRIFFCKCRSRADAEKQEGDALTLFKDQVSARSLRTVRNPQLPIPFANREHPRRNFKQHRIKNDVLPKRSKLTPPP
jgi:hypothetical protein